MRYFRVALVLLPLGLSLFRPGLASGQGSGESESPPPFLVSEHPCPDPQVFHDGSDWYIYGTATRPFFLQGKELGEGKMKKVLLDLDYAKCPVKVAQIWGFVVYRHTDGEYHAYGTLHLGNYRTVIAHFAPQEQWEPGKPITKWKFTSILAGDPARQDWNCYEAKILRDKNKSLYLMYVDRTGRDNWIYAQRMKSPGKVDHAAPRRLMLKPDGYRSEDRNDPGSMQIVEGGAVFEWKGKYILLYSVGDFVQNNYKLGMAFSETLIPAKGATYHKVHIPDPKSVWGKQNHTDEIGYLLQSQKPQWPNYCGNVVVGPGLGSFVMIDDKPWLFFHGYKAGDQKRNPENRFVYCVPATFDIAGSRPSLKWIQPKLPDERSLAVRKQEDSKKATEAFRKLLVEGAVWEGVSDWGQKRTTRSELRFVKRDGDKTEWDFVFLEKSIFNTPVPFQQRWTGEFRKNDKGIEYLHLTRYDGKAAHEYRLSETGEMRGKAVDAAFTYRFSVKK